MENQYINWDSFNCFFSAEFSKKFLFNCYNQLPIDNAESKSFNNCYPFMYFLEHGKTYYKQAQNSPLSIQPILLFYGLVHLLKACLLTVDPNYPNSTSVLAHGVTTRKRKKQHYLFSQDEIKIQKNGLFTTMMEKMYLLPHLEGEKIKMEQLFYQIPELSNLFFLTNGKNTHLSIDLENNRITIPKKILGLYFMNETQFIDYLQKKQNLIIHEWQETKKTLTIDLEGTINTVDFFKWNCLDNSYSISLEKENIHSLPELAIHYLLLYNLGMIARYEIEWWSELLKTMPNNDHPFIESFLGTSIKKGPQLIYKYLENRRTNPFAHRHTN